MNTKKNLRLSRKNVPRTNWDNVASWYDGWMGKQGSQHHCQLAIPALLALLRPQPRENILDIGAGQGVLTPFIIERGGRYTGVDASRRLLRRARRYHGHHSKVRFLFGDARRLQETDGLQESSFAAAVFLLSIQDMSPLADVLASASWALQPHGRLVILMTHPCFRVPRQSGWGWDDNRKLQYRRVDSYLTPLPVPIRGRSSHKQTTRSFHRPLQAYINGLAACGLMIDQIQEIPRQGVLADEHNKAAKRADREIPLFLGIRAIKVEAKT